MKDGSVEKIDGDIITGTLAHAIRAGKATAIEATLA
jgi:hypothetical protein